MVRFKYQRESPNEPYLLNDLNPRRPRMQDHMLKIVYHFEKINADMVPYPKENAHMVRYAHPGDRQLDGHNHQRRKTCNV